MIEPLYMQCDSDLTLERTACRLMFNSLCLEKNSS